VSLSFKFQEPFEAQVNRLSNRKVYTTIDEPVLSDKEYGKKLKEKNKAEAQYPRNLLRSGITEKVEVEFVVAPDGTTLTPRSQKNRLNRNSPMRRSLPSCRRLRAADQGRQARHVATTKPEH